MSEEHGRYLPSMTTEDEAPVQSGNERPDRRANGNPGGRGIPRGRVTCSGCGAEGVNIRTCPGDGSPHEATTEYQERTNGPVQLGDRPVGRRAIRLAPRAQAQRDADQARRDAAQDQDPQEEDGPLTRHAAEADSWGDLRPVQDPELDEVVAEATPRPALEVTQVTVRLATTYPALAAARLEAFIEDELDESLWLATDLDTLVPLVPHGPW